MTSSKLTFWYEMVLLDCHREVRNGTKSRLSRISTFRESSATLPKFCYSIGIRLISVPQFRSSAIYFRVFIHMNRHVDMSNCLSNIGIAVGIILNELEKWHEIRCCVCEFLSPTFGGARLLCPALRISQLALS